MQRLSFCGRLVGGMGLRTRVVIAWSLTIAGCETDVDSPFTGVSAGGTGSATATATGQSSTGSGTSTSGSTTTDTPSTDGGSSTGASLDASTTQTTASDPCDPDPCVAPEVCLDGACVGVSAPGPADVVITELQPDPDLVSDDAGEWFELLNLSAVAVDLAGCELADQGSDSHTIAASVVIEPGARAVLGRSADANGGVSVDYVYGTDISLGNSGDELALRCAGTLVDEVVYTGSWPFDAGAAMQLDPASGAANDDVAAWCEATAPYGDGDLGSPGSPNAPC